MGDNRWSVAATKLLIYEYERCNLLYDTRHPFYKNRKKRLETYNAIAGVLQENGHMYSIEDVKKKLNGLRSQYLAEKMKISSSKKSGSIYEPTVYWYSMLQFLETSTADESISNLDGPSSYSQQTEHTVETTEKKPEINDYWPSMPERESSPSRESGEKYQHSLVSKRKAFNYKPLHSTQASIIMPEVVQTVKKNLVKKPYHYENSDPVDTFGKFVVDELRAIREVSCEAMVRQAKRRIQKVLLQTWDDIECLPPAHSPCSSATLRGMNSDFEQTKQRDTRFNVSSEIRSADVICCAILDPQKASTRDNTSEDIQDPLTAEAISDDSQAT